jgi:diguanylate cyclase (GGDEF)-like protein
MTDLPSLVEQTLAMLAERLDMSLVLVIGAGGRRHASVSAYSHGKDGHGVHPCPGSVCLNTLLGAHLPTNLDSIDEVDTLPIPASLFRSTANAGVVALRTEDEVTGALIFEPYRAEHYWRSDLEVIEAIAPHVSAAINVARMHEQVKEDALTDGLTGALNYRALQQELAKLIEDADPFDVLMFDVVGLKPLNDTVGHLAGDQLLRHSVEVIRSVIGPNSVVGRIGGDEFGVLLSGNDAGNPQAIGQEIVKSMERDVSAAYRHTVTLRFGWAAYPVDGRTSDLLLHVADQRMYLNHPSGRSPS